MAAVATEITEDTEIEQIKAYALVEIEGMRLTGMWRDAFV
jgi:hypothetical protein